MIMGLVPRSRNPCDHGGIDAYAQDLDDTRASERIDSRERQGALLTAWFFPSAMLTDDATEGSLRSTFLPVLAGRFDVAEFQR